MDTKKRELFEEFFQTIIKIERLRTEIIGISAHKKAATFLQLHALLYLSEHQNSTIGELSSALQMSSPAVAQFTNRLVKSGLIEKTSDKNDKRTVRLALTPKGKTESRELPALVKNNCHKILKYINEDDIRTMINIMSKLINGITREQK